jgi:hypothetical protein
LEVSDKPFLSISQSAYVISNDLKYFVDALRLVLLVNLFFLSLGWLNTIYQFDQTFHLFVYFELSLATVYYLVVFFLKSPYKKLKQWIQGYLDDAYTVVFDTTIPRGNNSGEKILNLASSIFPQLRDDYEQLMSDPLYKLKLWFKRNIIRTKKSYGIKNFNYQINSDSVDLLMKTGEGNFVVKDFKDKIVTVEVLKDFIRILITKFRVKTDFPPHTDIFRVICVAKTYDDELLNRETLEKLMTQELNTDFEIDLIVEESVGYSVLWVGS